jgi:hypothetical protein
MGAALTIIAGAGILAVVFIVLLVTALTAWAVQGVDNALRGLPFGVGDRLADILQGPLNGLIGFARLLVGAAQDLLRWAAVITYQALEQLHRVFVKPLQDVVTGLNGTMGVVTGVLSLAVLPPIEREIPGWFRELERAAKDLPNEPAFRSGGPFAILLSWLRAIWALASRLGPFLRLVALPVGLALAALWGLIELLGRITRLETIQAGLVRFTEAVRQDQLRDEAAFSMLVVVVNGLILQSRLLQVDLEKERAARVAALQQEQMARQDATRLLEAQRQADRSQWSPLLTLTVLALLSGSLIDVLRKTAECDPCKTIDQSLSDLPARVAALEAYGEY